MATSSASQTLITKTGLFSLPKNSNDGFEPEPKKKIAFAYAARVSSTDMVLRAANHCDSSSIAAISIEVWVGTYLKRGVSAFFADYALKEFTVEKTRNLINDPEQFIVVSENKEGIDGFIRVTSRSAAPVSGCSEMEISTFYVQPRHHGKGIGKRLLSAALEHCRDACVDSVWLTTNAENDPAIAFYLAQGFEHIGETDFRIEDRGYLNNVYRLSLR